jgi:hypothetical protein
MALPCLFVIFSHYLSLQQEVQKRDARFATSSRAVSLQPQFDNSVADDLDAFQIVPLKLTVRFLRRQPLHSGMQLLFTACGLFTNQSNPRVR